MTVEIPKKILFLKYLFETEGVFPQNFLQNVSRKFIAYDHWYYKQRFVCKTIILQVMQV